MTIEIPDIDIDNSTIEELKAHSLLVAGVDNTLRAHHIKVLTRIITLANEKHEAAYVFPVDRQQPRSLKVTKIASRPRASKADFGSVEDDYNLDDFK